MQIALIFGKNKNKSEKEGSVENIVHCLPFMVMLSFLSVFLGENRVKHH